MVKEINVSSSEVNNSDSFSLKENFSAVKKFFSNKKVQWCIVGAIMIALLWITCAVRVSNLDLLVDKTTNESIPMALDPFYFLRIARTYLENNRTLPEFDSYRHAVYGEVTYLKEILPFAFIGLFDVLNFFGANVSLGFAANISTVVFYGFGLIAFFFLCYVITKNKWLSVGSCALLSVVPSYLYRTMAGFTDHEAIGMFALFLAYLSFVLAMKKLDSKENKLYFTGLFGLLSGFLTIFTVASWGGSAKFIFIIFPLAMFLYWIFNIRGNEKFGQNSLLFYGVWIISFLLCGPILGFTITELMSSYLLTTAGLVTLAVLVFLIIDFFVVKYINKLKFVNKKYRILYSLGGMLVLGILGLFIIGKNPLNFVGEIFNYLLHPFGTGRISLTVAENSQPYLSDWISDSGKVVFWLFFSGMLLFGTKLMKSMKSKKHRVWFLVTYLSMIFGILFSRINSTSVLNGESLFSKIVYFVPLFAFWIYLFYLRFNDQFTWTGTDCFIFAWMFFILIAERAASRIFFAITPFMCFMAVYCVTKVIEGFFKTKDETWKVVVAILSIVLLVLSGIVFVNSYNSIKISSKYMAPSTDTQWQNTMAWVRNNTAEDAIFSHWWDYGYWVEYLGNRGTIADGGHFQGEYVTHNIARYLLTTPWPKSANSFVKSMNVSYLLIDPTDLGKYSAYSRIGGDENWDRFSAISLGTYNSSQTQETENETVLVYYLSGIVDEDISYDSNNDSVADIFLPGPTYNDIGDATYNSYIVGVFFRYDNNGTILQPTAIYYYNNKYQYIPLRYVYYKNTMIDFKSGLDAVISIIPSIGDSGTISLNGGMIYLSPKVKDSLFAQLYLLDDVFGNYENFVLVHEELDDVMTQVRSITGSFEDEEFLLYGDNLRGPIKIWDVSNVSEDAEFVEEFYDDFIDEGKEYGYLDYKFE